MRKLLVTILALFAILPFQAFANISYDSGITTRANNLLINSFSLANSNSATLLFVSVTEGNLTGSSTSISVTYGLQSLAKVTTITNGTGANNVCTLWYINTPTTGTNLLTSTLISSGGNFGAHAVSAGLYLGTDLNGPMASVTNSANSVTSISTSLGGLTLNNGGVSDNAFVCGATFGPASGGNKWFIEGLGVQAGQDWSTPGANTTFRTTDGEARDYIFDSNNTAPVVTSVAFAPWQFFDF